MGSCCNRQKIPQEEIVGETYVPLTLKFIKENEKSANLLRKVDFSQFIRESLDQCLFIHKKIQEIKEENPDDFPKIRFDDENYNLTLSMDDIRFIFTNVLTNTKKYAEEKDNFNNTLRKDYFESLFEIFEERFQKANLEDGIKFYFLIAAALVYCKGRNVDKLEFLYSMFADTKEDKLNKTENLKKFMYAMFEGASGFSIGALNRVQKNNQGGFEHDMDRNAILAVLDGFEFSDCKRLTEIFNILLFGNNNFVTHQELLNTFRDKKLVWIFNSNSIKYFLEQTNIKKNRKTLTEYRKEQLKTISMIKGEVKEAAGVVKGLVEDTQNKNLGINLVKEVFNSNQFEA